MADSNAPRETSGRSAMISGEMYEKIAAIARAKGQSVSRAIEDLLEAGLEAQETERQQLLALAERMRDAARDAGPPARSEFARMIRKK